MLPSKELLAEEAKWRKALEPIIRQEVAQQIIETMVFPSKAMTDKLDELGIPGDGIIYEAFVEHWVKMKYALSDSIAAGALKW